MCPVPAGPALYMFLMILPDGVLRSTPLSVVCVMGDFFKIAIQCHIGTNSMSYRHKLKAEKIWRGAGLKYKALKQTMIMIPLMFK